MKEDHYIQWKNDVSIHNYREIHLYYGIVESVSKKYIIELSDMINSLALNHLILVHRIYLINSTGWIKKNYQRRYHNNQGFCVMKVDILAFFKCNLGIFSGD